MSPLERSCLKRSGWPKKARDCFGPLPIEDFMDIHPLEPEPMAPAGEPAVPNPTHLPVEPEFSPQLPPAEPEDPGVKPVRI